MYLDQGCKLVEHLSARADVKPVNKCQRTDPTRPTAVVYQPYALGAMEHFVFLDAV